MSGGEGPDEGVGVVPVPGVGCPQLVAVEAHLDPVVGRDSADQRTLEIDGQHRISRSRLTRPPVCRR